jgi:hypothetical protein
MPAFPGEGSPWFESQDGKFRRRAEFDVPPEPDPGLTKRELFAAMAMEGLMAEGVDHDAAIDIMAIRSVQAADALLAELAKKAGAP